MTVIDLDTTPTVVSAAGLIDEIGKDGLLIAADGDEAPEAGDHAWHGEFRLGSCLPFYGITVRYLQIPGTAWGDYLGGTHNRSNYRLLHKEYSDYVITVGDDRSGNSLVIPLDSEIPQGLYDSAVYLHGECVLDEMDMSAVEDELAAECWENMGRHDFQQEILSAAEAEDADSDELYDLLDNDKYVDELFDHVRSESEDDTLEFVVQGAAEGYWSDLKAGAALAWAEIKNRRAKTSV